MVAMLILALTVVLGLRTLQQARQAADVAWEYRRAQSLLAQLMETAPRRYAESAGLRDGFRWTVETTATGAERPIEVCRRAVDLKNVRSGRTYGVSTLEACPIAPGAAA
jgi:hypothetical protein